MVQVPSSNTRPARGARAVIAVVCLFLMSLTLVPLAAATHTLREVESTVKVTSSDIKGVGKGKTVRVDFEREDNRLRIRIPSIDKEARMSVTKKVDEPGFVRITGKVFRSNIAGLEKGDVVVCKFDFKRVTCTDVTSSPDKSFKAKVRKIEIRR